MPLNELNERRDSLSRQLWDHSSTGEAVVLQLRDVSVLLRNRTIGAACRYLDKNQLENGNFSSSLQNGQDGVLICIDQFEEKVNSPALLMPGDLEVPFKLKKRSVFVSDKDEKFYDSVLKSLYTTASSQNPVNLSNFLRVWITCCLQGPNCTVHVEAATFDLSFKAIPIQPVPLIQTPLTCNLQKENGSLMSGLLTMDSTGHALVLLETDLRIVSSPLVGLWVSGIESASSSFVWASCLRYILCSGYAQKLCRPPQPFLLILFGKLPTGPKFYDCLASHGSSAPSFSLLKGQVNVTVTKVPSFTNHVTRMLLHPSEDRNQLELFSHSTDTFSKEMRTISMTKIKGNFPMDDLPRSKPSPTSIKNFNWEPSVPDLSLLSSEGSHFPSFGNGPNSAQMQRIGSSSPSIDKTPVALQSPKVFSRNRLGCNFNFAKPVTSQMANPNSSHSEPQPYNPAAFNYHKDVIGTYQKPGDDARIQSSSREQANNQNDHQQNPISYQQASVDYNKRMTSSHQISQQQIKQSTPTEMNCNPYPLNTQSNYPLNQFQETRSAVNVNPDCQSVVPQQRIPNNVSQFKTNQPINSSELLQHQRSVQRSAIDTHVNRTQRNNFFQHQSLAMNQNIQAKLPITNSYNVVQSHRTVSDQYRHTNQPKNIPDFQATNSPPNQLNQNCNNQPVFSQLRFDRNDQRKTINQQQISNVAQNSPQFAQTASLSNQTNLRPVDNESLRIQEELNEKLNRQESQLNEMKDQIRELVAQQKSDKASVTPHHDSLKDVEPIEKPDPQVVSLLQHQDEQLRMLQTQIQVLLARQNDCNSFPESGAKCSIGIMTSFIAVNNIIQESPVVDPKKGVTPRRSSAACSKPLFDLNTQKSARHKSARNIFHCTKQCDQCKNCSCLEEEESLNLNLETFSDGAATELSALCIDLKDFSDDVDRIPVRDGENSVIMGESVSLCQRDKEPSAERPVVAESDSDENELMPTKTFYNNILGTVRNMVENSPTWPKTYMPGQQRQEIPEREQMRPWQLSTSAAISSSIILPRLNYETLHFADSDQSTSAEQSSCQLEILTKKYLGAEHFEDFFGNT